MKKYIDEKEAGYIAYERGIDELPAVGYQVLTVPAIATGREVEVLGHNRRGYYIEPWKLKACKDCGATNVHTHE